MTSTLDSPAAGDLAAAAGRVAVLALASANGTMDVHGEEIEALLRRSRKAEGYVAEIALSDALALALRTGRAEP